MDVERRLLEEPGLNPVIQQRCRNASASLRDVLICNRPSGKGGVYAVCSAHPWVIGAAIQQAIEDDSVLHVESTSSQVNQLGGYTGQTPGQSPILSTQRRGVWGFPENEYAWAGTISGHFRGGPQHRTAP